MEYFILGPYPSGELHKEFPCEVADVGRVDDASAAEIVVEGSAFGGLMDVREGEIHVVALDRAVYATDEDDGAIQFLPLHDSDVRQRIVRFAISIVVPCIVEEDEIAWLDSRPLMEGAMLPHMGMDELDAVGLSVGLFTAVEVDAMLEEDRAGESGTVVGDAAAVYFDGAGTEELSRGADDSGAAGDGVHCSAAILFGRGEWWGVLLGCAGTAD